jgi:hypothetical protein
MTTPTLRTGRLWMVGLNGLLAALTIFIANVTSEAQSFSSGSDGSDGALTLAVNQGTVVFDPFDSARWGRVLDADGDGVYHFTTITINSGTTLRFQGDRLNRPVYWLASGNVVINGSDLDLSGAAGTDTVDLRVRRQVAIPGSGGYAGGAGGIAGTSVLATPGEGPGGGSGLVACSPPVCGQGGTFSGNRYLIPLVGGSGGAGAQYTRYFGGGAGGGAILIASSTSIAYSGGTISTRGGTGGGAGGAGGGGSGGAIRLAAPVLSGNAVLTVSGGLGSGPGGSGSSGWVRLEGFQISNSFQLDATRVTSGSPVDSNSLTPPSSIRVTAIDGVPVPANLSGSFVLADVTISRNSPVNVDIQARGIPPGTVVTLQVYPQTPTDVLTINLPTAQATLIGTVESSTATATFTFPYGFSRGFVRASWTQ